MAGTVWRGSSDLTQGPDDWQITATKITVTTYWDGPHTSILAQPISIGLGVNGYGFGLLVTAANRKQFEGGAGRLEITMEAVQDPSRYSSDALGASTYETEWAELTKPLETHPNCGILKPTEMRPANNALNKILTWEDWQYLTDADYDDSSNGGKVAADPSIWTLAQYHQLKEAGVDSYNVAAPIIRRTTEHLYPPPDLGDGTDMLQEPPSAANFTNISGFQWLGGPDRCTKSHRTFVRQTEWVGAYYWSSLIYRS